LCFGGWVWIAFISLVFRTSSQMIVTNARSRERAGHEDDKLFGPQKGSPKQSLNFTLCGQLHHLSGMTRSSYPHKLNFQKNCTRIVQSTFWIYCVRQEFESALIAHNTSTLTSLNWIICQPGYAILGGVWTFKYSHASSDKKC